MKKNYDISIVVRGFILKNFILLKNKKKCQVYEN